MRRGARAAPPLPEALRERAKGKAGGASEPEDAGAADLRSAVFTTKGGLGEASQRPKGRPEVSGKNRSGGHVGHSPQDHALAQRPGADLKFWQ
jgi:hypothetical protein